MALHKHLVVVFLACLINSCYAYQFYVGGRDGWVPNPPENYIHWAERMRFQVNDTLVFKYKKGSNSVLLVNKDDYDKCNTNSPIKKMDDGNSIFKFDHSGPFYFISGNKNDCEKGSQKLITVVLAIRPPPLSPIKPPSTPGNSPTISPVGAPPVSPVSQTPNPSPGNGPSPVTSPATSPGSQEPTLSPGNAPSPTISPATSPGSQAPTLSPGNAPSPTISPATSPGSQAPALSPGNAPSSTTSPATSPAATTPATSSSPSSLSPTAPTTPGSPVNSPPGSVAPAAGGGNNPPADIQSPTGSKNSAVKAFTSTSAVLVSTILTVVIYA